MCLKCCADKINWLLFHAFNFALFVCGLTLFGLGIWLAVDDDGVTQLDALNIPSLVNSDQVWSAAVFTMLAAGVAIFALGLFGCYSMKRARRPPRYKTSCLCIYELLIIAAIVVEVVFAILAIVYQTNINSGVETAMKIQVQNVYISENDVTGTSVSASWNNMQVDWKCCGSTRYDDYKGSKFANTTSLPVPYECCTMKDGSNGVSMSNVENYTQCIMEATNYPTYTTSAPTYLNTQGCYGTLKDWINVHTNVIIGVGFSFACLQGIGFVVTQCERQRFKKWIDTLTP